MIFDSNRISSGQWSSRNPVGFWIPCDPNTNKFFWENNTTMSMPRLKMQWHWTRNFHTPFFFYVQLKQNQNKSQKHKFSVISNIRSNICAGDLAYDWRKLLFDYFIYSTSLSRAAYNTSVFLFVFKQFTMTRRYDYHNDVRAFAAGATRFLFSGRIFSIYWTETSVD